MWLLLLYSIGSQAGTSGPFEDGSNSNIIPSLLALLLLLVLALLCIAAIGVFIVRDRLARRGGFPIFRDTP